MLKAQASPAGLILIVGLLLARRAIEPWLEVHAADWGVNPLAILDDGNLYALDGKFNSDELAALAAYFASLKPE